MKKFLALFGVLAMALALAACSTPAATNPDAGDQPSTAMKETINGQEINYDQNDVVIIADYDGQYVDQLTPVTISAYGDSTITFAVFGDIVDVSLMAGEPHSEGDSMEVAPRLSDALLTITDAPNLSEYVVFLSFMDVGGTYHSLSIGVEADDNDGILVVADSGKRSASVEPGHTLWATYPGDGYKFIVEVDESQTVQAEPMNFLYWQWDGEPKELLTQSVDCGDERWADSIRNIVKPTLSSDGDKIYYETDAYNRGNGAGANNHFTHVINSGTKEDSLLSVGGLYRVLSDSCYDPYVGYLILQGYENGDDGHVVPNYFLVTAEGDSYCFLGNSVAGPYAEDLVEQIRNASK